MILVQGCILGLTLAMVIDRKLDIKRLNEKRCHHFHEYRIKWLIQLER